MKLNHKKFRFVETEWQLAPNNVLKSYYAIDNDTQEMILLTESEYKEATNQEVGRQIHQKEIIADYQSELSVQEILDKHSITYPMLRKILNASSIKKRD